MRAWIVGLLLLCALAAAAPAEEARVLPEGSGIAASGRGVEAGLALSRPVPWRLRLLADPARLAIDLRDTDLAGIAAIPLSGGAVTGLDIREPRPGWSRLELHLSGPFLVTRAAMETSPEGAMLRLRLHRAGEAEFATRAALPDPPGWALPPGRRAEPPVDGPPVVVLDPGHGGLDPGAERQGLTEAGLMLGFARELEAALLAAGFRVVMTRDGDGFVPLETRLSLAHRAGADLFLSLHADALAEGEATGATLYTLPDEAGDDAARALTERHDRDDLLAGVDLGRQDDRLAQVLMDMARTETRPRTEALAAALLEAMQAGGLTLHRVPRQEASFAVLRSPDIPSVLIELGFLSSDHDLSQLTDPAWRARMVTALVRGLQDWQTQDAARADLRRR